QRRARQVERLIGALDQPLEIRSDAFVRSHAQRAPAVSSGERSRLPRRPPRLVSPPSPSVALARDSRSLSHLGFGGDAPADPRRRGATLLRRFPAALSRRALPRRGVSRRGARRLVRTRLLPPSSLPARGR